MRECSCTHLEAALVFCPPERLDDLPEHTCRLDPALELVRLERAAGIVEQEERKELRRREDVCGGEAKASQRGRAGA